MDDQQLPKVPTFQSQHLSSSLFPDGIHSSKLDYQMAPLLQNKLSSLDFPD